MSSLKALTRIDRPFEMHLIVCYYFADDKNQARAKKTGFKR